MLLTSYNPRLSSISTSSPESVGLPSVIMTILVLTLNDPMDVKGALKSWKERLEVELTSHYVEYYIIICDCMYDRNNFIMGPYIVRSDFVNGNRIFYESLKCKVNMKLNITFHEENVVLVYRCLYDFS